MTVDLKPLSPANPDYLERFLKDVSAPDSTPLDPQFVEVFAEGTPTSRLIVLLPGSYIKVQYMTDFAHGLSQQLPDARVIGINYPSRRDEYSVEQIDQFKLIDYVRWVMQHLAHEAQGRSVTLIGHSLGTIITQMVLLVYADQSPAAYKIDSAIILGGGPPKITWRDYLETLPHLNTVSVVMKMVRDPKAFAFGEGMAQTLHSDKRWRDLHDRHLIYTESRTIMRETFTGRDYTYVPHTLLDAQGIKVFVLGGDRDLFVTKSAILRAAAQWGGDHRILPMEHTGLVLDETGVEVGGIAAEWIQTTVGGK